MQCMLPPVAREATGRWLIYASMRRYLGAPGLVEDGDRGEEVFSAGLSAGLEVRGVHTGTHVSRACHEAPRVALL